jgi:hypothetical protein
MMGGWDIGYGEIGELGELGKLGNWGNWDHSALAHLLKGVVRQSVTVYSAPIKPRLGNRV